MKNLYCFLLLGVLFSSCISIPKQAPELSIELGNRLSGLEKSHIALLNTYFDHKRKLVDDFIESTWLPQFSETFFSKEQIEQAWDEIVESKNKKDRLDFLVAVGPQLQVVINEKRQELIDPLNQVQRELETVIREEYNVARSMNNTLTSFLTSAAKVRENQQRYLDMIKVTDNKIASAIDQTDKVFGGLLKQAEQVNAASDKMKAYTDQAEEYKTKLNQVIEKIKK